MGPVELFAIFLSLLFLVTFAHFLLSPVSLHHVTAMRWFLSVSVPSFVVIYARLKGSLSCSGTVAAWFMGFCIMFHNYMLAATMITFFATSSRLTSMKKKRKRALDKDYDKASSRDWLQVVSNGGPALAFSLLYVLKFGAGTGLFVVDMRKNFHQSFYDLMSLGCLAGASGDTWASEIGAVFGSPFPRLLTTFERVPAGTNGAVSLVGTISSILGGLTIGTAYVVFALLLARSYDTQSLYTVITTCTACGLLSSGIDSLLGATIQFSGFDTQRKCVVQEPADHVRRISGYNLLNNNSVNLFSTLCTSLLTPFLARHVFEYFYVIS